MKLSDDISTVKGVGPASIGLLKKLGIETVADLIDHWPRRYEDYSAVTPIAQISPGAVTIRASIGRVVGRYSRRGLHITEAHAMDSSGQVKLVWFNQPYRAQSLKGNAEYFIAGNYDLHGQQLSLVNPTIELVSELPTQTARILPIYPETKGLTSKQLRTIIRRCSPAISLIDETLPAWLARQQGLISHAEAIQKLHLPETLDDIKAAQQRLSFEELFELQLASALERQMHAEDKAEIIEFKEAIAKDFTKHLPFSLTDDQKRTVWQIYKDMSRQIPMNRLIEGDVGSGKTVVAAMAAIMVLAAEKQVLFMAPTEILARQHAETIYQLFAHTKWLETVGLLIGSLASKAKTALRARIASGECRLVIGTHALIQDAVATKNVGLVIIDEQHRFGVAQRQKLKRVGGYFPHLLTMTATPIPRTLALTLYGELDISIIATKPAGRQTIDTTVTSFAARHSVYEKVEVQLQAGRQAFVVAPLISPSEMLNVAAAEDLAKDLQSKQLKHRRIGLLHGKMKADQKEEIMSQFIKHELDVLVATTVIEVGVNIPNATVMVVEGAERFGLAQLHQLRGRVGRREEKAFCYLIPSQDAAVSRRLQALTTTNDGFALAELDLKLRGPGAIYGTRQSGVLDLRIASLSDRGEVAKAKAAAAAFLERGENLLHYPQVAARVRHFRSVTILN